MQMIFIELGTQAQALLLRPDIHMRLFLCSLHYAIDKRYYFRWI